MSCLNFRNKQSYMNYVQTLSDDDIVLQRKLMLNLLDTIENEYYHIKFEIKSTVIPNLKAILNKKNIEHANKCFKEALEWFFDMYTAEREFLKENLKHYSNYTRGDSDYNREESICIIEETYDKITTMDEKGIYDKCLNLLELIINQSAIIMYLLYNVALLDKEFLMSFLGAPRVLFGGLNEKGEPDLSYTIKRYIYQIKFDIKFVENDL